MPSSGPVNSSGVNGKPGKKGMKLTPLPHDAAVHEMGTVPSQEPYKPLGQKAVLQELFSVLRPRFKNGLL